MISFKTEIKNLGAFKKVNLGSTKTWTAKSKLVYVETKEITTKDNKKEKKNFVIFNFIDNGNTIYSANKDLSLLRLINKNDLKKGVVLYWEHSPEKLFLIKESISNSLTESDMEKLANKELKYFNLPKEG